MSTIVLPVCAECGAAYGPWHEKHGEDPCACFGAHPSIAGTFVNKDALGPLAAVLGMEVTSYVVYGNGTRQITLKPAASSRDQGPAA